MTRSHSPLRLFAALAAGLGLASAALAGPPLICHPFVTEADAPLLPWAEGHGWRLPDPAYDVGRVVDDTLTLLSSDAPIMARMENMRRATIYADARPEVAAALLRAVVGRTASAPADPRAAALEWFDAGYLVETYRQLGVVYEHEMLPGKAQRMSLVPVELAALDGYALVAKALALAPEAAAELEFAASLLTREPLTAAHRERAAAAAPPGSVLAQNLAHFD
jgi:hypothetical protein